MKNTGWAWQAIYRYRLARLFWSCPAMIRKSTFVAAFPQDDIQEETKNAVVRRPI
jgi:hypothetical protein